MSKMVALTFDSSREKWEDSTGFVKDEVESLSWNMTSVIRF